MILVFCSLFSLVNVNWVLIDRLKNWDRLLMMYTICGTHKQPAVKQICQKRAPDLSWFSTYSLFGTLCLLLSFLKISFSTPAAEIPAYPDSKSALPPASQSTADYCEYFVNIVFSNGENRKVKVEEFDVKSFIKNHKKR